MSNVSGTLPILSNEGLGCSVLASVCFGEGVPTTPDGHGEDEDEDEADLRSDCTTDFLNIEGIAKEQGAANLGKVVQKTIEGLSAGVEVRSVDSVKLVGVKPVRGPEHGEEKDDEGLESDGLVEPNDLGLPTRVLHQDNAGAIWSDNIGGIAEEQSQNCASEHENNERNIGAIANSFVGLDIDVLTKRDLECVRHCCQMTEMKLCKKVQAPEGRRRLTKLPMTAPILKIAQNQAKYLPFCSSRG